jgi:hypothetical protein
MYSMSFLRRHVPSLLLLSITKTAKAQGIAVSSTAAWSSQIVAFWGAVFIGVRSSEQGAVTNAISSLATRVAISYDSIHLYKSLRRGDWTIFSGWDNGLTRMDVVVISWKTPQYLKNLVLQVSTQIAGLTRTWEIIVVGRKLTEDSQMSPNACWIQSPRCADFCTARVMETRAPFFPLSLEQIEAACALLQGNLIPIDQIIYNLVVTREFRATRCAYVNEVPAEVQQGMTPARFFTGFQHKETNIPFVALSGRTGQFGVSRSIVMACATLMYAMLHLTVAVAVGLMAAATGRGLAVWLMVVRATLNNLGVGGIGGDEAISVLWGWNNVALYYEAMDGGYYSAGDAVGSGIEPVVFLCSSFISVLEICVIGAGWGYGAWSATKLKPVGVVGHGTLVLSVVVTLALSARAAVGVRRRVSGRLIGLRQMQLYIRYTIGQRRTAIPAEPILSDKEVPPELKLLVAVLNNSTDDGAAVIAAMSILRSPLICTAISEHVTQKILKFEYKSDAIVGAAGKPLKTSDKYHWIQSLGCIFLTAACAVTAALYAYLDIPTWIKPVVEVLLVISVAWFSILDRTGALSHDPDTYLCFVVASLVSSALWYVGVSGAG